MNPISLDCPKCGASLPARELTGEVECSYCGTHFAPRKARAARTQAGVALSRQEIARLTASTAPKAHSGGGNAGCIITAVSLGILVAGIGAAMFAVQTHGDLSVEALKDAFEEGGSQGKTKTRKKAERIGYDSVGGLPHPIKIDGERALVARFRHFDQDHDLYISAFAVKGGKELWRFGPLGTYSEGAQHTNFAVIDGRVAVSDIKNQVHILSLKTGKKRETLELSDRVTNFCLPQDGKGSEVWLALADKRDQVLDVKKRKLRKAEMPAHCGRNPFKAKNDREKRKQGPAPTVKDFEAARVLIDGKIGVAAGHKSPGTKVPRAIGFDPSDQSIRWNHTLGKNKDITVKPGSNEHDDLADGRYISTYAVGKDALKAVAFDARSGKRLWDTELADTNIDGVLANSRHVFVVSSTSIQILDARSGAYIDIIGF